MRSILLLLCAFWIGTVSAAEPEFDGYNVFQPDFEAQTLTDELGAAKRFLVGAPRVNAVRVKDRTAVPGFTAHIDKAEAAKLKKKFPGLVVEPNWIVSLPPEPEPLAVRSIEPCSQARSASESTPEQITACGSTPPDPPPKNGWEGHPAQIFEHHHKRMSIPELWAKGITGEGIVVGVIDTGGCKDQHKDLAGQVIEAWSEIESEPGCEDLNSHGSHVAGLIAALNNAYGTAGIAPGVKLLLCKGLNKNGQGSIGDLTDCWKGAVDKGAHITNHSWGANTNGTVSQLIQSTADYAASKGSWTFAAAGNAGTPKNCVAGKRCSTVNQPAIARNVVSVSALHPSLTAIQLASFSSRGVNAAGETEVTVTADGQSLLSTLLNNGYGRKSGTSMATPVATGLAALILSARKALKTLDLGLNVSEQGKGILDPWCALGLTRPGGSSRRRR